MDALGPQAHGRQREQSTPGADIEEGLAGKRGHAQHVAEGLFRLSDTVLIEYRQKALPVLAELESLSRTNLGLEFACAHAGPPKLNPQSRVETEPRTSIR